MKVRKPLGVATAAVLIVAIQSLAGAAAAQSGWLTSSLTESLPSDAPKGEPAEQSDTQTLQGISDFLSGVNDFPVLRQLQAKEVTIGSERMFILSYASQDGGLVDVVVQQLMKPFPLDVIDPAGRTDVFKAATADDVVVVDKGHTLQVLAVAPNGVAANIIIERINREAPLSPSELELISNETAITWATSLVGFMQGEGS